MEQEMDDLENNTNNQIAYKVLHKTWDGRLFSCTTESRPFRVEYYRNQWVEPGLKNSKLFVFKTLECAKHFIFLFDYETVIYRCEYKIENQLIITRISPYTDTGMLRDFWSNNPPNLICTMTPPAGTLLVDKVKLLEEIS